MLHAFIERRFAAKSQAVIDAANVIIDEYAEQGFILTLRQLFYQFVARGLIENTERSYKRIGNIVSDGRMAGLLDWMAIEDRTRNLRAYQSWASPAEAIQDAADVYRIDTWADQPCRVEVWIEKEALTGVIEPVCRRWHVPYFACRGYVSQSEQFRAGVRFYRYMRDGQAGIVLHLGDHDPSGIDMTRDNEDRLDTFSFNYGVEVERLALNRDQVNEYDPPPNPTKLTDSRAPEYVEQHGNESWELDALDPKVLDELIENAILERLDRGKWDKAQERQENERQELLDLAAE